MSKMSEIDRQRQEVEEVMNEQEVITIPIYYSIDDETGIRHYDTDSIRNEFEQAIKQLEANEQAELDGWNDKMRDYAMDNMTCDCEDDECEVLD